MIELLQMLKRYTKPGIGNIYNVQRYLKKKNNVS